MTLRLGLRTKFFLYSNTLIVVTMTLVAVLGVMHERQARFEEIERRARSITGSLAIPITDALLYEDLGLVQEVGLVDSYLEQVAERNRDLVEYLVVADRRGRVTHSTRWEWLGEQFPRVLGKEHVGGVAVVEQLDVGGSDTLEVRTTLNISTRYWGTLIAGFSLDGVRRQVAGLARRAATVALLLMLANSVLTGFYVESLIRPILQLNQQMQRAGRGDLSARANPRRGDEVGELARAFNLMMDRLEEARQREEVQKAQLTHTEKMVAVGTLAAGVAHEVANPLAGIMACLENLRNDPEDAEMRARYLDLIRDGLQRIERTVRNLLDFARPREMRLEPVSVNHAMQHVTELVAYQLRKAGIELRTKFDREDPLVMADHFQLEQLLLNLVLNAVQAMPEGGTLTLRTRGMRDRVVAEVSDTGCGIPPEVLDRIFDPFFTTRGVGEGTGLGLAVSDTIARAHGGSIEVESTMGRGSTFRVVLPMWKRPGGEV